MIAIVPAAGTATRMNGIPKFLLPTPEGTMIDVMLRRIDQCAPREVMIGVSHLNYDLLFPQRADRHFYKVMTQTMSETVLYARPHMRDRNETVIFGMPDTYFEDEWAFWRLNNALAEGAQVAVGCFRARPGQHRKVGMCKLDESLRCVLDVVDKPETSDLQWLWGVIAWTPAFWPFIDRGDPHIGYALPRAIAAGLSVRAVTLSGGYWDCGTVEEYFDCVRHFEVAR